MEYFLLLAIPVVILAVFTFSIFMRSKEKLEQAQTGIHAFMANEEKADKWLAIKNFMLDIKDAFVLIFKEKEIIFFSFMQLVAIAAAYYLWTVSLGWVPQEVWDAAKRGDNYGKIYDVILFLWAFLCVGIAAFFIGIFSACTGAVHFLNRQGKESTIPLCLKIVLKNIVNLWIFHWVDGWITVRTILERLPSKRRKAVPAVVREALYYAWKLGTIGILPSLIVGNSLTQAAYDSVNLVKNKTWQTAGLRVGYSAFCWIVGILTYLGVGAFLYYLNETGTFNVFSANIKTIYMIIGIPLLISVGFILMFLRPVYIIASCGLYSDYLLESGQGVPLADKENI